MVVPVSLRMCTLCAEHHPQVAENPGERQMYDTIRRNSYWQHMANDVYQTVGNCIPRARNCKRFRRKRHLQLFFASKPFKFIAMDVLKPLPGPESASVVVTVMMERYSNVKKAIHTSETTATHVANAFLDHWIVPYGIPDHLRTDSSTL